MAGNVFAFATDQVIRRSVTDGNLSSTWSMFPKSIENELKYTLWAPFIELSLIHSMKFVALAHHQIISITLSVCHKDLYRGKFNKCCVSKG